MMTSTTLTSVRLGLRANWEQFTLLVIVNAFVGAMVGLERRSCPDRGSRLWLVAWSAMFSFLVNLGGQSPPTCSPDACPTAGEAHLVGAGWPAAVPFLIIFQIPETSIKACVGLRP
jgi:hypothetical protein